jgi:hypothetical protein
VAVGLEVESGQPGIKMFIENGVLGIVSIWIKVGLWFVRAGAISVRPYDPPIAVEWGFRSVRIGDRGIWG